MMAAIEKKIHTSTLEAEVATTTACHMIAAKGEFNNKLENRRKSRRQ
jgi:hypothetical protein